MSQDNGEQQPNADADNTADQMNNDVDERVNLDEIDDIEELRRIARTSAEQKKHFRDKFKKLQNDPRLKEPEQKPDSKSKKAEPIDREALKKEILEETTLANKYPNLTNEDLTRARAIATSEGKTVLEVVEDSFFQDYLNKRRDEDAANNAAADPSSRTGNPKKDWSRYKNHPELVRELSKEDYQKFVAWLEAK